MQRMPEPKLIHLSFENVGLLRGAAWLIQGLDWRVHPKEHWIVLGANGAGKSTLAALALARVWPTTGKISVLGKPYATSNVQRLSAQVGFFQPALQSGLAHYHANLSVLDVVLTGFDASIANYRDYTQEQKERALSLINGLFFGPLCHYSAQSRFAQLSSGEQRQVLFLRAIVRAPRVLVLDEPFESFDIPSRFRLESLLNKVINKNIESSVLILHRVEEIPSFATHALLLKNGKPFCQGPIDKALQSEKISELYGLALQVEKKGGRFFCFPK